MNHAELKNYAPQARRDFIQAVTDRAAFFGIAPGKIEPVTEKGDVAIIGGRAFPASIVAKRKRLLERIDRDGFSQTMEALAYTWFNRFVAIRFMELHGYLEHGYRVLSNPDPTKSIPEILELAEHVDLPGLSKENVIDLKLDGNKESELYQILLLAQCHALHSAMPFLFEAIDDETELVLPENLLHSESIIRKLVAASAPEDWEEVEVLGWLYQFYIAERKDEVMARKAAVPTEDIPAVTQLFTPHWIVRYLVENSLGRLWLLNRPSSKLREHMPYYIEGEPETDFLKITKPEEIRLLDPACGSGHMLTYAFDLLFLIYKEEGYVPDDIPALILRHNLYGLEICPRATQLAQMALVLKARQKSRRFSVADRVSRPHIVELSELRFAATELGDYARALGLGELFSEPLLRQLSQFEEAKTFGSLIEPCLDEQTIAFVRNAIEAKDPGGELFLRQTHLKVLRVLEQAEMLTQRYHLVLTNPPYMGGNGMNAKIKAFLKSSFSKYKSDLFAAFTARCLSLICSGGRLGLMTPFVWMFLTSYEDLRRLLLIECTLTSLVQPEYHAFFESAFVPICAFTVRKMNSDSKCVFIRLTDFYGESLQSLKILEAIANRSASWRFEVKPDSFTSIPGMPIAYWIKGADLFKKQVLGKAFVSGGRNKTHDNEKHLRFVWEVSSDAAHWKLYLNGGDFRKYYGNELQVVDWSEEARRTYDLHGGLCNPKFWDREGITWSLITSARSSFRIKRSEAQYSSGSPTIFSEGTSCDLIALSFLNSPISHYYLKALNPTLNTTVNDVLSLPYIMDGLGDSVRERTQECLALSETDWNNFEVSRDFREFPLLRSSEWSVQNGQLSGKWKDATLSASRENWRRYCEAAIRRMQELESENNRAFINAYGLQDELQPEVPEDQITLARSDARTDIIAFLSYAIGCMMGRYSLDKPGLILADAGDSLIEYLAKVGRPLDGLTFVPDDDGIIPVLEGEWFKDDVVARVQAFLRATFGEASLDVNLRFIEESVGKDLRKYFLVDFYKDHLQTYKKRPIYWLFTSGKERAFQALVYLHRYHEGTLSRMRTEYVIPLQGKIASRIDQLADDIQKATSTSHRKRMDKERDTLLRQRTELQAFDEKLRHYADQRIQLELDDGVKVNYGKFGDLLTEVKAITGGSDE
jgi:SAM-dependent methyltransferase